MPIADVSRDSPAVLAGDVFFQVEGDTPYVFHTGLCWAEESGPLTNLIPFEVVHICAGIVCEHVRADVIGNIKLNANERKQIRAFVNRHLGEQKTFRKYAKERGLENAGNLLFTIHPHAVEPQETVSAWRFSCSGLVMNALQFIGIVLVDLEHGEFPTKSWQAVATFDPYGQADLHREENREYLIQGDQDNIPVLLAGYLLQSLARTDAEIREQPYQAREGDEFYPSRADDTATDQQ